MSDNEENETFGPKMGIKLTIDQANLIVQRHLNLHVTNMTHINRGYNNRVYLVTTSNNDQDYVLRLSGRFWTRNKTENEVAALLYISKMCPSVPVPKIYGYCTDKEKSGVDAEYILMEKVNGEPLEYLWKRMLPSDKNQMLEQLAEIFRNIQTVSFSQIGSFQLKGLIGDCGGIGLNPQQDIKPEHDLIVGKGIDFHGGPFDTYLEYFQSSAKTEIGLLRTCPFMMEAEGYEKRLQRIENFVAAFDRLETIPEEMRKAVVDVPFVFTHGDFEPRNILVNKETMKVTAILDWEFAGAFPVDEDWFSGFAFAGCDTSVWRVFNDEPPKNDNNHFDQEMLEPLREYFLEQLKTKEVLKPDDIPGHMIRSELYYFKGYICPWWLREERNPMPDSHYGDRTDACKKVDAILDKYEF